MDMKKEEKNEIKQNSVCYHSIPFKETFCHKLTALSADSKKAKKEWK